ncbi:unnamed protein product [Brugia timori]|uniref:Secreted protein n=1 Tax=Brugia timori TaxID=42155 RepID=A0A0R3R3M6_9BILA|nr:unnamed protein product [Brugia timori]
MDLLDFYLLDLYLCLYKFYIILLLLLIKEISCSCVTPHIFVYTKQFSQRSANFPQIMIPFSTTKISTH